MQGQDVLLNGLFIPAPQFAGVTCDFHWPDFQHVLDPLVLNFYENPTTGNFGNYFIVNGAIFDEEMRLLIPGHDYNRMAHALLDNPDTPIRDIELLSVPRQAPSRSVERDGRAVPRRQDNSPTGGSAGGTHPGCHRHRL